MPIDSIPFGLCCFFLCQGNNNNNCPISHVGVLENTLALICLIVNKLAASCSMVIEYVTRGPVHSRYYYFPI